MFLFILKLISTVRKAIAGRRYPSQLAWGLALGVLLGLIPHGNLLTVALVLGVLALRVNHAMVALVGIGLTFVAPKYDPQFHAVGQWFFEQPQVADTLAKAWQLPLVPWTDLNNTVVMGSFLIGAAAVLPIVLVTYPVFRRWSLALERVLTLDDEAQDDESDQHTSAGTTHASTSTRVDQPHTPLKSTRHSSDLATIKMESTDAGANASATSESSQIPGDAPTVATSGRVYDVRRIDPKQPIAPSAANSSAANSSAANSSARTTHVAITIDPKNSGTQNSATALSKSTQNQVAAVNSSVDDQQKIDEALSYLLRQLRDSKDKDAA